MDFLKTRLGMLLDRWAISIDFRRGIYGAVAVLLLLWLLVQVASFYSYQDVRHRDAIMRNQIHIGEVTQELREIAEDWFWQVAAELNFPDGASSGEDVAQVKRDAFYALVGQELAWCSNQEPDGVDYMAQLQEIATVYNHLVELQAEKGTVGDPRRLQEIAVEFRKLQSLIGGLQQQQLYDVVQYEDERVAYERERAIVVLFLSGSVVVFVVVLILLLYRSIYLRLRQSMDVLRAWVAGSFFRRVTDVRLLDPVVDHDDDHCATCYPFSAMAHDINRLGDVIQIFLTEVSASLEAMAAGNTERRIDTDGFPWRLRQIAVDINANIDRVVDIYMKADQEQASLDEFQRDLSIISQSLGAVADAMGANGVELMEAAQVMEGRVQTTEQEAGRVQQSMDQAAQAVGAISESISEVAGQVREASSITHAAVEQAQETRTTIAQLEQASAKIGNMVDLITSIARQTQMLAMNATIEAARAGEAGRGFAVVASEVKQLATQTSGAAQDISSSIEEIQSTTESAMQVIQTVAETIERINSITVDIERNAAQQEQAAKGIAGNVTQANRATTVMGENLKDVRQAADITNHNVDTMNTATQELRKSIDELDTVVRNYVGEAESDDIELF